MISLLSIRRADGSYYIEVHQPLSRKDSDNPQTMPIKLTDDFQAFLANPGVDKGRFKQSSRRSGLPVKVNVGENSETMGRDYQQLKPIAPFTITQPQPVFEGK